MRNRYGMAVVTTLVASAMFLAGGVRAELPRRISASAACTYFVLDDDFFGLGGALGAAAAFRYELFRDIYFENSLGFFETEGSGVGVGGFASRINVVAVIPVFIPYRPVARFGVGFLSVNPVTVTPIESFRPAQTTFYFCGGAGITRSFLANLFVEAEASVWIAPYRYRVYEFNRYDVTVSDEWFTHLGLSLGAVYTF